MTYGHHHRERSGRGARKLISEVKKMRVDSRMNKYIPRNSKGRAMKKRVAEIEAYCMKRAKDLDATFTTGYNSNPYSTHRMNEINLLVVGNFHEVNN